MHCLDLEDDGHGGFMSNKLGRVWEGGWVANTTGFVMDFDQQNEIWEGFERDPAAGEIWAPERKKSARGRRGRLRDLAGRRRRRGTGKLRAQEEVRRHAWEGGWSSGSTRRYLEVFAS
jgi:hypothetical protein